MKYQGCRDVRLELNDVVEVAVNFEVVWTSNRYTVEPVQAKFIGERGAFSLSEKCPVEVSYLLKKANLVIDEYISKHEHEMLCEIGSNAVLNFKEF